MEYVTNKLLFFFLFILLSSHVQALDKNLYEHAHIIPNLDGSITSSKQVTPTAVPPNTSSLAYSRDVPLNLAKKTWVRVYLPKVREPKNRPIVVFAHGGAFISFSAAEPNVDSFCSNMASQLNVIVVSVDYRLAPEHRLPAAYDDLLEALYWVKGRKDEWVRKYGDISRCAMMGESSGGNMVYNVGLKASVLVHDLKPLVIKGLVLIQPFFGWIKHGSEDESTGRLTFWKLSLPVGTSFNNPYFNPMFGGGSSNLKNIRDLGWRVGIAGCDGDTILFPNQVVVYNFLKRVGIDVSSYFCKGYYHGVFVGDPTQAPKIFRFVQSLFSSELA